MSTPSQSESKCRRAEREYAFSSLHKRLVVRNWREAVEQFRKHHPDITLMDLQMPEMGGIDAMSAIRDAFPEARVIVPTTYTGDVQVLRALQAGARAHLLKASLEGTAANKDAAQLSIGEETVKGHLKNVLAKLAANDRTHAVTFGIRRGIIDL